MKKEILFTGKTIEDAVQTGCQQLGIEVADAEYEVVSLPSKGFLGFGAADAKVKFFVEDITNTKETAAPVKEIVRPVKPVETIQPVKPNTAHVKTVPAGAPAATAVTAPAQTPTPAANANAPVEDYVYDAEKTAKEFLKGLFDRMELTVDIESKISADTVDLTLTGENIGIIIGHRGETLDSVQYLASLVANRGKEKHTKITVDTENYRSKREDTLAKLARRTAVRVVKTHRNMALEPMNANERRIIHSALQEFKGVSTHSVGDEPRRKVVITYNGTGTEGTENAERLPVRDNRGPRSGERRDFNRPGNDRGFRRDRNDRPRDTTPQVRRPEGPKVLDPVPQQAPIPAPVKPADAPKNSSSASASGKLSDYLNK